MYNKTTLVAEGRVKLILRNPKDRKKYRVNFMVVKENNRVPSSSKKTSERMNLITVNYDKFKQLLHSWTAGKWQLMKAESESRLFLLELLILLHRLVNSHHS